MEEFKKEFFGVYSNPRLNAMTACALSSGSVATLELEAQVELLLNQIFEGIFQQCMDCKDNEDLPFEAYVEFQKNDSDIIIGEVVERLRDFGYTVQVNCDTQEEVDHLNELSEMSKEDSRLEAMLDEFFHSQRSYVVRWEPELLNGFEEMEDNEDDY